MSTDRRRAAIAFVNAAFRVGIAIGGLIGPTFLHAQDGLAVLCPALDRLCFPAFLDDFAQSFPESLNLLLLDGAPVHTTGRLVIPENVLLIRLPPYSPELNPVERLWQDLRARLGRDLPLSLDALQHRAATVIRAYTPEVLASLCGYPYLLHALAP